MIDQMTLAYARRALQEAVRGWLFDRDVKLIDFGYRQRAGQSVEDELCIRIHTKEKYPRGPALEAAVEAGRTRGDIPETIGGFATDVIQADYRPHQWWNWWSTSSTNQRATRADPMQGGISISDEYHYTFGTLGGKVVDRQTGEEMLLSNWHVLVGDWLARPSRSIYQPGRLDGGTSPDTVATLTREAMAVNLDAAVATLNGQRRLINDELELEPVRGVGQAHLGMEVVKSGRKTAVTHGRVTAVEGVAKLPYAGMDRVIRNIVTIDRRSPTEDVSAGGDSGSWWLDPATWQAVGLHFAGSDQPERALAMDMQSVLDALKVDIAV
jgi:endonuclease G